MVVGNNESMTTKNADESLAISMAMAMQRYDARRIAQWSTSRLHSKPLDATSGKCLCRIAQAAAMVDNVE